MDIQHQFPTVYWVWAGGISFVYEVHPLIVVKVPKSGPEERESFRKELKIYEILSRHPPCPSLVQCFYHTTDGIFLEYMRGVTPYFDPLLSLGMNDLAQGVTFLGSLNLAHGDLNETDHGMPGSAGLLGPRTEQFALGSLYYLIHYGFELYDDQCLVDDPYEHGPEVLDLLQNMVFPKLDGDPLIDNIIDKCWHNQYLTLPDLATHTETLLKEPRGAALNQEEASTPGWRTTIDRTMCPSWSSVGTRRQDNGEVNKCDDYDKVNQKHSGEHGNVLSKEEFCRDLEKRGLLRLLTSDKPTELGFKMEHRHVLSTTPAI
ncbi:serine/threonine protein kinase [Penicillium verhagenii]|uniref:serine/threonine protein kinase n=1 Tax=Penicillium verhagenii TaxID=1562060 RepID=UPI00254539B1|nr:serine/threonine protein kinase [Penicillium verhagenii]KAJ5924851.1 serine/threonine protein kinase [Penicillium verhagenii]